MARTRPCSSPSLPILTARGYTTGVSPRKPLPRRTDRDLTVCVRSPHGGDLPANTLTSIAQVPQSLFVPLEVIVDLELLVICLQGPQLPKERQIFSWVLPVVRFGCVQSRSLRYLLCVLCDHQNEREVVHPQREVKQRGGIYEEDDIFHSIFNQVRCAF